MIVLSQWPCLLTDTWSSFAAAREHNKTSVPGHGQPVPSWEKDPITLDKQSYNPACLERGTMESAMDNQIYTKNKYTMVVVTVCALIPERKLSAIEYLNVKSLCIDHMGLD